MNIINLVMIVKNEELKIERCIVSVKDLVDKIIIIDTGSTDKTKEVALKLGAIVYDYKWDDNFSNARNYGLKKSDSDWNLILDADEFITKFDKISIKKFMNNNKKIIGRIKIVNLFEKNEEIKKSTLYLSRLAPKGVYFEGAIHEQLDQTIPRKIIDIEITHDGYLKMDKFDRNIKLILDDLSKNNDDAYMNYQAAKTYYLNGNYDQADLYFKKFYNNFDINKDMFFKEAIVLYLYNMIETKNFEMGLFCINNVFDILNDYCDFYFVCGVFFTELVLFDTEKYISYYENIELSYLNALEIGENKCFAESVEGTGSYLAAFNLGLFYELNGDINNSIKYYKLSGEYGYDKANKRIDMINI